MSQAASIDDFNLLDPKVQSCPYALYAAMHAAGPVHYKRELDAWIVSGYEELREVLQDTGTFSSDIGDNYFQIQGEEGARFYRSLLRENGWDHVRTLQRTDPPLHGRYRRLLDKVFTPRNVKSLSGHIREVANSLIDAFAPRGECEFVSEFALPLPGTIIAEQIGLDRTRLPTFKNWCDNLIATACRQMSREELREAAALECEMQHHLAAAFEERRREPRDDLLSHLVNARSEEDEPLSDQELQNLMHQLVSGGFDTVPNAIAHGLWLLIRHPGQYAKLRADPGLRRGFIYETLRYESSVQGLMRRTTRAVRIGETEIPEGAHVIVRYAAANRDPRHFDDPDRFDIERPTSAGHLGFGYGVHFCVGRLLALEELDIAFELLLSRLADIELGRQLPDPPHHPNLLLHPLIELPIRFRAAG